MDKYKLYEERAAIMQFDGGLTREEAEKRKLKNKLKLLRNEKEMILAAKSTAGRQKALVMKNAEIIRLEKGLK